MIVGRVPDGVGSGVGSGVGGSMVGGSMVGGSGVGRSMVVGSGVGGSESGEGAARFRRSQRCMLARSWPLSLHSRDS